MSAGTASIPNPTLILVTKRPISVAFGSIMPFEVFVQEVTFNDNGTINTKVPVDLTGVRLTWTLIEKGTGKKLCQLTTDTAGEIDRVLPQATPENTGRAIINIDETCTSFSPGDCYEHDVFGEFPDGRREPVIELSDFEIRRVATRF